MVTKLWNSEQGSKFVDTLKAFARWHLQLGNIVIPESVNPERIASNFDVFDFELSENDMSTISARDDGNRLGPDPRTFDFTGR